MSRAARTGQDGPRVVVTGMYRSGSTRVYNLVRTALLDQHPDARCAHYPDPADLDRALVEPGPGLFKEHVLSDAVVELATRGDVVLLATIRDPKAAMTSLCSAFGWPAETALHSTDLALSSLERVAAHSSIYTYETATAAAPRHVRQIVSDAGLPVSLPQAGVLAYQWSRRRAARLSAATGRPGEPDTYDPVTLLHPGHAGPTRVVPSRVGEELDRGSVELRLVERVAALAALARQS